MSDTAIAKQSPRVDILAVYKPEQYNVLTPVKVYDAPPPFVKRVAVPVNITGDDFHQLTGKDNGRAMIAASGLQKMAAALGFQKDTERSGFQEPPARTHVEDCMYVMFGRVLLDQGWTDVQAQYTWRYEHVAALLSEGSERFKAELRWKESKAETGALSRIICHLLGIKRTRAKAEWEKPIVIVRDEPDVEAILDDPDIGPEMRRALAAKAIGATGLLYGGRATHESVTQQALPKAEPLMLGTGANDDEPEGDWEPVEPPEGVDHDTGEIVEGPPAEEGPPPEDDEPAGAPTCTECGAPCEFTCPDCGILFAHVHGAGEHSGRTWWRCPKCAKQMNEKVYASKLAEQEAKT